MCCNKFCLTKFESQHLPIIVVQFLVIFSSNHFKISDNNRPEAVDEFVEFVEVGLVDCHG